MHELRFIGKIVNGIGKHAEIVIPGRVNLPDAPPDWPEKVFPGSLNLRVLEYPDVFTARGLQPSTKMLDTAGFEPEFVIPKYLMLNNMLKAIETMPHRGTAQVWRASLEAADREVPCWVLRRFGSGLADQLELVSGIGFRGELNLSREQEWPAVVTMWGQWQSRN